MTEPWDLPTTEDGRDQLLKLAEEYEKAGKIRELGNCYARLAHVVKHVGMPDGYEAFPSARAFGERAVECLRQAGDKKELARALLSGAVPLSSPNTAAELTEALAIAREIGDREMQAETLFRMTRADGVPGHTIEEALEIFEELGDAGGCATCLLSISVERTPRSLEMFDRAIALYEESGAEEELRKARIMRNVFFPGAPRQDP